MEPSHFDIPWSSVIQAILAASFGAWAWLLKSMGNRHLESIEDLAKEMREMRKEVSKLTERLVRVEARQDYLAGLD